MINIAFELSAPVIDEVTEETACHVELPASPEAVEAAILGVFAASIPQARQWSKTDQAKLRQAVEFVFRLLIEHLCATAKSDRERKFYRDERIFTELKRRYFKEYTRWLARADLKDVSREACDMTEELLSRARNHIQHGLWRARFNAQSAPQSAA